MMVSVDDIFFFCIQISLSKTFTITVSMYSIDTKRLFRDENHSRK